MTNKVLLGLAAAIGGAAILALQGEREETRETGVTVVPGGFVPPGTLAVDGVRGGAGPIIPTGAEQGASVGTAASAQAASAQAWGPPGVWATPAEFAPPE